MIYEEIELGQYTLYPRTLTSDPDTTQGDVAYLFRSFISSYASPVIIGGNVAETDTPSFELTWSEPKPITCVILLL